MQNYWSALSRICWTSIRSSSRARWCSIGSIQLFGWETVLKTQRINSSKVLRTDAVSRKSYFKPRSENQFYDFGRVDVADIKYVASRTTLNFILEKIFLGGAKVGIRRAEVWVLSSNVGGSCRQPRCVKSLWTWTWKIRPLLNTKMLSTLPKICSSGSAWMSRTRFTSCSMCN